MEPTISLTAANVTTRIFTVKEAADFLRVCESTVNRLLYSGQLGSIKIGDRRLITNEQMQQFVQSRVNA